MASFLILHSRLKCSSASVVRTFHSASASIAISHLSAYSGLTDHLFRQLLTNGGSDSDVDQDVRRVDRRRRHAEERCDLPIDHARARSAGTYSAA